MADPRAQQALDERRAKMTTEERQIAALEQIADELSNIRGEIFTFRHLLKLGGVAGNPLR